MLIRNVSEVMVNGVRGNVAALQEESVVVHFPVLNMVYTFSALDFKRYVYSNYNALTGIRIYREDFNCMKRG